MPWVWLKKAEVGEVDVLVDFGQVGNDSANLEQSLFESLVMKKHVKVVGSGLAESINGTSEGRIGASKDLALGEFKVKAPFLGEGDRNMLGLGFWSRFMVTLDLPHSAIYLKKGKGFARPDLRDQTGLHLLRVDGKTAVHSVDKDSVAAAKGIKGGDQILRLGTDTVDKTSMFRLRRALSQPGETVLLTLRRNTEEMQVELVLK